MRIQNVACPACGGVLPYAEGLRLLACGYCGSEVCVMAPSAIPRSYVEPRMDRPALESLLQRTFEAPAIAPGFRTAVASMDARIVFVPFYEVSAVRCLFSRRNVLRPDRGIREADTALLPSGLRMFTPAVEEDRFGLTAVELPQLRGPECNVTIRAFDLQRIQGLGGAMDPDLPLEPLLEKLRAGSGAGDTVTLEETAQLLYYPVWQVFLSSGGSGYRLAVDAVQGKILSGRAPGNASFRAIAPVLALGLAGWILGRFGRLLLLGASATEKDFSLTPFTIVGLLAALAVAVAVAQEAWKTLRYSLEMEWVGGLARLAHVGASEGSWMEGLMRSLDRIWEKNNDAQS